MRKACLQANLSVIASTRSVVGIARWQTAFQRSGFMSRLFPSKVHSAFHPFVVGKMSTIITGVKLCMQRDWSGAHPCRELQQMSYVMVEANEKGASGLPSTSVSLLSCLASFLFLNLNRRNGGQQGFQTKNLKELGNQRKLLSCTSDTE